MAQREHIAYGKTYNDAVEKGLAVLGISEDDVSIELIKAPSKGFLGIGSNSAEIKITYDDGKPEEVKPTIKEEIKPVKTVESKPTKKEKAQKAESKKGSEIKAVGTVLKTDLDDIKQYIDTLLMKMRITGMSVVISISDEKMLIDVTGEDSGIIIGRRGETLDALQYIISLYVNKNKEISYKVILDIERYRAKRQESLESLAKRIAESVVTKKKNVTLEPMQSYERRIIHSILQDVPDIATYSTGNDPYRRVVVTYKGKK